MRNCLWVEWRQLLIVKYELIKILPMPLYVTCPIIEDHTHHVCQKYHFTTARSTAISLSMKVAERWVNIFNILPVPAVLAARRGKALSGNRGI